MDKPLESIPSDLTDKSSSSLPSISELMNKVNVRTNFLQPPIPNIVLASDCVSESSIEKVTIRSKDLKRKRLHYSSSESDYVSESSTKTVNTRSKYLKKKCIQHTPSESDSNENSTEVTNIDNSDINEEIDSNITESESTEDNPYIRINGRFLVDFRHLKIAQQHEKKSASSKSWNNESEYKEMDIQVEYNNTWKMSNNSSSYKSDLENSIVLNINLDALKKSASNVFQVQCISIQEFNERGFHKKTDSEVAIMEYIHLNTHIPVPKNNLNIKKKNLFLLKIIDIQLAFKEHMFSKIGSIFFDGKNDQFKIGQVIESIFFTGEQATLPTMERCPFKTTKEYILAVIRNQMHYYSMFKSTKKQKCLIPKYEELYQLVPKYFQNDGNDMFVLTHIDFHTLNIFVKNDKITGVIDWE
ncbi:4862_t:CDS:10 [Racocetra persica]|uniref:4862_t:CDS:1 n=1 Tax=Racocetra persica TaxID=160502 RepID=A0ACA9L130_9GLOM|nr:4862_t:CDS:10 [Racocetra persica]